MSDSPNSSTTDDDASTSSWWTTSRTLLLGGAAAIAIAAGVILAATAGGDDADDPPGDRVVSAERDAGATPAVSPESEQASEPGADEASEPREASASGPEATPAPDSERQAELDWLEAEASLRLLADVIFGPPEPDPNDASGELTITSIGVIDDDPIGQTGSFDGTWLQTPDVDIAHFVPWTAVIDDDVFDGLFTSPTTACGATTNDYTVTCPPTSMLPQPGEFFVVALQLSAAIEADGAWRQYGLAFDDDGDSTDNYFGTAPFDLDMFNDTEYWYRYQVDPDGDRSIVVEHFDANLGSQGLATSVPSAATVVEYGDLVVWMIPQDEVPGSQPMFRATAFRNEFGPDQVPMPETSGGDVTGIDVSTLTSMPTEPIPVELSERFPADTGTPGTPRVMIEPSQRSTALLDAQLDELASQMTEAFVAEDVEAVRQSFHFLSTASSADGCLGFAERIFDGAESISLEAPTVEPLVTDFLVSYVVDATVTYPTGVNEYPISIASDTDLRMAPVFSCDQ